MDKKSGIALAVAAIAGIAWFATSKKSTPTKLPVDVQPLLSDAAIQRLRELGVSEGVIQDMLSASQQAQATLELPPEEKKVIEKTVQVAMEAASPLQPTIHGVSRDAIKASLASSTRDKARYALDRLVNAENTYTRIMSGPASFNNTAQDNAREDLMGAEQVAYKWYLVETGAPFGQILKYTMMGWPYVEATAYYGNMASWFQAQTKEDFIAIYIAFCAQYSSFEDYRPGSPAYQSALYDQRSGIMKYVDW